MLIVGISAYYHDSAACILKDGEILAAAQEERFTRKKQDSAFPKNALEFCLKEAGVKIEEVDYFVFYEKPFLKFERLLENYLAEAPFGFSSFFKAIPVWLKEKLFLKKLLVDELKSLKAQELKNKKAEDKKTLELLSSFALKLPEKLRFSEHHLSHAASAFYPSPFEKAAVLTIDGVGEWTTCSLAKGDGKDLKILKEIHYPHSLGLLYSALTYFLGFKVNSGEYKVMGLAPYGKPRFTNLIKENLIDLKEDGSFHLNLKFFNYTSELKMTGKKMEELFGIKRRESESKLEQVHMDIAASLQEVTEEAMLKLASFAKKETGLDKLCLAGGVALNCVGNGKILKEKIFDQIWIQPAAGDAGGALGAALAFYHSSKKAKKLKSKKAEDKKTLELLSSGALELSDKMKGAYLGPKSSEEEVRKMIKKYGAKAVKINSKEELVEKISNALKDGKVVGWHQGKMEFGPRSLGARSILGDPRSPEMQKKMNLKIKFRESFRPFAPSVLREDLEKFFELKVDSPYMLLVADVKKEICKKMTKEEEKLFGIEKLNVVRSKVPAVTHVDYSARVQTVHKDTNPLYHSLIEKFKEKTGCSVLVNTSFNVRGEPIVCTAEDSYKCFMRTEMDILAIEDFLFVKEEQPSFEDKENFLEKFELD